MSDDTHPATQPSPGAGTRAGTPTGTGAPFAHLPEPVDPADTVATQDVLPAPDPEGGRSPNHEWMLRYG